MDVTKAVVVLAIAGGIVELAKAVIGGRAASNPRVLAALVIVASFASVFLLRYSVWANEQVIGDKPLDALGVPSLIVASIAVAAAESVAFLGGKAALRAVSNIGENQPTAYDPNYGKPVTMGDKFGQKAA